MQIDKRKQLINFFTFYEENHSVYSWSFAGISVWLLVKMRIFNNSFQKINSIKSVRGKKKKRSNLIGIIKNIIPSLIETYTLSLPKVDKVYCGGKGHRVFFDKNVSFNRYFDPLMDIDENNGISVILIEYDGGGKLKCYKNNRVVDVSPLLTYFLLLELFSSLFYAVKPFKKKLEELDLEKVQTNSRKLSGQIKIQVIRIRAWKRLFSFILRKTRAKELHTLCYYANPMFGAILAARQSGILVTDMQHGTQGPLHPAYTFTNVKNYTINLLPNTFNVWDINAATHLKNWIQGNKNFSVELFGNPWLTFLSKNENLINFVIPTKDRLRIVVTIQPVLPYLNHSLIECIKLTNTKFNWWLRFHPRMSKIEKDVIYREFEYETKTNVINWDNGNSTPLPLLLANSGLHISKYSGSISEAALVNKKTIVLDEIGLDNYPNLIESGHLVSGVELNALELENLISKVIDNDTAQENL